MKILILALTLTTATAADIRTVGGKQVDLQPIHDWTASKDGARPMAHWKEVRITTIVSDLAGYQKCGVTIGGNAKWILARNLPQKMKEYFTRLEQVQNQMTSLTRYIVNEKARVTRADAITPTGAGGSPGYVDSVMRARYQVNLAANALDEKKAELDSITREFTEMIKEKQEDLAMFSGQMYAGLEIWDFGRK